MLCVSLDRHGIVFHFLFVAKLNLLFCIFRYASLLLVITASLSRKLEDVPFCSRKMKRRPLLRLSTCAGEQNSIFLPLETQHMPEIFELFHSSFFIIPSMLPLWLQALDYFIQKRYSLFCIVFVWFNFFWFSFSKFRTSTCNHSLLWCLKIIE